MAQHKRLKVWSADRTTKKAVSSSNFVEFREGCKTKFNLSDNEMTTVLFVLNEDGTEVDEEYYGDLQICTTILLLKQDEKWVSERAQPKPLKVWSLDRTIKHAFSSYNFAEFKKKCKTRFNLSDNEMTTVRFVLNEDGTEVDEDYYETLHISTTILLLRQNEIWVPDTEEKRLNFFRQLLLCQDLGTRALRILFDGKVPNLHAHLAHHKKDLMTSKWKCNPPQLALLFPANKSTMVTTTDMDFSLLYKLIRNTVSINAPVQDWGNDPTPADITIADDIERVRYYRNTISHNTEFQIDHSIFKSQWNELSQAIERISSGALTNDIQILRNQNLDNTFMKRVYDELKKELREQEHKIQDVTERVENVEKDKSNPIPPNVRDQHLDTVKQWKSEDSVHTETKYYKKAYEKLKEKTYLTVVGTPGMGKTATIRHIALKLEKEGYSIIPVSDLSDIIRYGQVDRNQVFVKDDILGVFGIERDQYNTACNYEKQICDLLENTSNMSKLLMTCRKSVYNEAIKYKCFITNVENIVDLEAKDNLLDETDKKDILVKHCVESNVPTTVYENLCFDHPTVMFPLLCGLFAKNEQYQILGNKFFKKPYEYILEQVDNLQMHNALRYASLVLCALNDNKLSEVMLDSNGLKIPGMKEKVFKRCECDSNTDNWKIMKALSNDHGTYTTYQENTFTLIHDIIYEVIIIHYGRQYPEDIFQFMPSSFIHHRVRASKQESRDSDLTINIGKEHYSALSERLYRDICDMHLFEVFMNECLYNNDFCENFIKVLHKISYEKFKSIFLSKRRDEMYCLARYTMESFQSKMSESCFLSDEHLLLEVSPFSEIVRAVSWVVLYGHTKILQYIIDRVIRSRESTDLVFGSEIEEQTRLLILGCLSGCVDLVQLIIKHIKQESLDSTPWYDDNAAHVSMFKESFKYTPLTAACKHGNLNIVNALIDSGCDINKMDKLGNTPLTVTKSSSIATKLIELKCKIHTIDSNGRTSLWQASCTGNFEAVEYLIKQKCDVNKCDNKNISPLYIALKKGHLDVAKILLAHGGKVTLCDKNNKSPLYVHVASGRASCDVISLLIKNGANVNLCDKNNKSPLYVHLALFKPKCDVINLLIKIGADATICDKDNMSPLYVYVASGRASYDVVSLLIKHGADVNFCDKDNKSPLYRYVQTFEPRGDVIDLLIKHGANVNLCDKNNKSPLYAHLMSRKASHDVVSLLIEHGADVTVCDKNNKSPLYVYIKETFEPCCDVIRLLIEHGADATVLDKYNKSLLYVYMEMTGGPRGDVITLLIEYGADATVCDKDNKSPLYVYLKSWKVDCDVIKLLIKYGADVNLCDKDNKSPLYVHVASFNASYDVVSLLIEHGADATVCDKNNKSPLYVHVASMNTSCDVISLLIEHGANVALCDNENRSPLYAHLGSSGGSFDVVSLLIEHGADATICDKDKKSPLYKYVETYASSCDVINLLIKHGADVTLCDNDNKSLLYAHLASLWTSCDVINLLINNGANVTLCDKDNKSPLYAYVASGRVSCDVVRFLIKHGAEVNVCDKDNKSPLYAYLVSCEASCDVASLLLKHGADVNLCDRDNKSPLYAYLGLFSPSNYDVVNLLLKHGADVALFDKDNKSPLYAYLASGRSRPQIVSLLIKYGAGVNICDKENKSPLYVYLKSQNASCHMEYNHSSISCEVLSLLIDHGANINLCDNDGKSPLYAYIESPLSPSDQLSLLIKSKDYALHLFDRDVKSYTSSLSCEAVSLLIDHGANVNLCDKDKKSPLYVHLQSLRPSVDVINILIKHGADINICDKDNKSPLYAHVASLRPCSDVISALIEHGIDVNVSDKNNKSPLYVSVSSWQPSCDVVSLLIKHGANVNLCDNQNKSPLYAHVASWRPSCDVVSLLIKHGANVNVCDKDNKSPLYVHVASTRPRFGVANLLINHGADINLCDRDGKSPFYAHVASKWVRCDVLSLLISHGADLKLCGKDSNSPLFVHLALDKPCCDVVSLLLTHGKNKTLFDKGYDSKMYEFFSSWRTSSCDAVSMYRTRKCSV